MSRENTDWKATANRKRIKGQIITGIVSLLEVHDDMEVAQHLVTIMRSKGKIAKVNNDGTPVYRDMYKIKDPEFLKELENYVDELQALKTGEDE